MVQATSEEQLPPGQVWGRSWIIYAALGIPKIELNEWRLKINGLVKNELELTYEELDKLPKIRYVRSFHCVTKWSIKQVSWEGVGIRLLAEMVQPLPEARWVMFHCADGYTTPIPLEDALHEDAIVALRMDGKPLRHEQGFPARPFIPHLYGWKSAKWLTGIEFMNEYRDGYWEIFGYAERGNVWLEERFKGGSGKHVRRSPVMR